jgi:hypothetical protein
MGYAGSTTAAVSNLRLVSGSRKSGVIRIDRRYRMATAGPNLTGDA